MESLVPGSSGVPETSLHIAMNSCNRAGRKGRRRSRTQLLPSSAAAIVLLFRRESAKSCRNWRQSGDPFIQFERQKIFVLPSPIVTLVDEWNKA
jgi:hypothetical protein